MTYEQLPTTAMNILHKRKATGILYKICTINYERDEVLLMEKDDKSPMLTVSGCEFAEQFEATDYSRDYNRMRCKAAMPQE